VHVPAVLVADEGTHFAGARHGGPMVGSLLHDAPSTAGAAHVPVVAVADAFTQRPLASQSANPVMGALPMSPQAAPAATRVIVLHVPTPLPAAVGTQTSPRSPLQLAAVFRVASHAAPTVAPDAMHVPIVIVATSSPTHASPAPHGATPVRHGAALAP